METAFAEYGTLDGHHGGTAVGIGPAQEVAAHGGMDDGIDLRGMLGGGKQVGGQHGLLHLSLLPKVVAHQLCESRPDVVRLCGQPLGLAVTVIHWHIPTGLQHLSHIALATAYAARDAQTNLSRVPGLCVIVNAVACCHCRHWLSSPLSELSVCSIR